MTKALEQLDFKELEQLWETHCPQDEKKSLSKEEAFQDYLPQWRRLFIEADQLGWGIMCHCG